MSVDDPGMAEAAPPPAVRATGPREKDARDTALGCRDRAAADQLEADSMDTAHGRERLEHSAASWASRAQLLQRLEDKAGARAARAEGSD